PTEATEASSDLEMATTVPGVGAPGKKPPKSPFSPPRSPGDPNVDYGDNDDPFPNDSEIGSDDESGSESNSQNGDKDEMELDINEAASKDTLDSEIEAALNDEELTRELEMEMENEAMKDVPAEKDVGPNGPIKDSVAGKTVRQTRVASDPESDNKSYLDLCAENKKYYENFHAEKKRNATLRSLIDKINKDRKHDRLMTRISVDNFKSEIEDLEDEIQDLQQQLEEKDKARAVKSDKEFENLSEDAAEEIEFHQRALEEALFETEDVKRDLRQLEGEFNAQEIILADLMAETGKLSTNEYEAKKQEIEATWSKKTIEAWRNQKAEACQAYERRIQELKNQVSNKNMAIDTLKERETDRDKEIAQLKAKCSGGASVEHETCRTQMAEANRAHEKTIQELKNELLSKGLAIDEYRGKEEAKDQQIAQLEAGRNSDKFEHECSKTMMAFDKLDQEKKIQELQNELTNKDTAINGYRRREEDNVDTIKDYQLQLYFAGEDAKSIIEQLAQLTKQRDSRDRELADLKANSVSRDDCNYWKNEAEALNNEWTKTKVAIEGYRGGEQVREQQIAQLTKGRDYALATIQQRDQEISQLKAQHDGVLPNEPEPWKTHAEGLNFALVESQGREVVKDQEIARFVKERDDAFVSVQQKDQEIAQLVQERDDALLSIQLKDQEITQLRANQSSVSPDEYQTCKVQIEELHKESANKSIAIDEYRSRGEAQDQEITRLRANQSSISPDDYQACKVQMEELRKESANKSIAIDEYRRREQDQEIAQLRARDIGVSREQHEAEKVQMQEQIKDLEKRDIETKKRLTQLAKERDDALQSIQHKDQEIIQLKAHPSSSPSDEVKTTKDQIQELKQELEKKNVVIDGHRSKEKDNHATIAKLQEEREETLQTVKKYDRNIKEQKDKIDELGKVMDQDRRDIAAKSDEVTELNKKFHEAEARSKDLDKLHKDSEAFCNEQKQKIQLEYQTIHDFKQEVRKLKTRIDEHERERKEIWEQLGGNRSNGAGDLARNIERQKASYEKELADIRRKFSQQCMKYNQVADREFAKLQDSINGLQKDIDGLKRLVEVLRQRFNDMQDEVKATTKKSYGTQAKAATEVAEAQTKKSTMVDAATQVEEVDEEKRHGNELQQFSPPLLPVPKFPPHRKTPRVRKATLFNYSTSESEEEEQPQKHVTRRRRSSSPFAWPRTSKINKDASTQTDDQLQASQASQSSAQATMAVKSDTLNMGTQICGEMKRATVDQGTQTDPIHSPAAITRAAASPQTSSWRKVPWWLLLLVLALLLVAAVFAISAHRERMMWLAANDYTRRAVISVRQGGGTGTRVPAWLWREPLVNLTNHYYL
ncbi:MAG: hypothetical protein L6R41_007868, partial [Letrouitia leprolyta]